jgi:hypothetical protein
MCKNSLACLLKTESFTNTACHFFGMDWSFGFNYNQRETGYFENRKVQKIAAEWTLLIADLVQSQSPKREVHAATLDC